LLTKKPIWGAIAHFGALINLFNLLPIWQLDGGRGFHALSRLQAFLLTLVIGVMWYITGSPLSRDDTSLNAHGMLLLLLIVAGVRTMTQPRERRGDWAMFHLFVFLLVSLALLGWWGVSMP